MRAALVFVVVVALVALAFVAWTRREDEQVKQWQAWCRGEYAARGVSGVSIDAWCNPRDF